MRSYQFSHEAEKALENQIDYLISQHALAAARALERRVRSYLHDTICHFPYAGTYVVERGVYESWIPGTRLIIWYTVTDRDVMVAMIWHASQARFEQDGR